MYPRCSQAWAESVGLYSNYSNERRFIELAAHPQESTDLFRKHFDHFTSPDCGLQMPGSVSGIPRSPKPGTVDDQLILGPRRANDGSQVPTWSLSLGLGSRCTPYNIELTLDAICYAIPRIHTINIPMFARL